MKIVDNHQGDRNHVFPGLQLVKFSSSARNTSVVLFTSPTIYEKRLVQIWYIIASRGTDFYVFDNVGKKDLFLIGPHFFIFCLWRDYQLLSSETNGIAAAPF